MCLGMVLLYWWMVSEALAIGIVQPEEQATCTEAASRIGRASWPWSSLMSLGEGCVGVYGVCCVV